MLIRSDFHDSDEVCVVLSIPSVGPVATSGISSAQVGRDWNKGTFLLVPTEPLSNRTSMEQAFDLAQDLLFFLATKPAKRDSYESRTAKRILLKTGYKDTDFEKFRSFYHKDK